MNNEYIWIVTQKDTYGNKRTSIVSGNANLVRSYIFRMAQENADSHRNNLGENPVAEVKSIEDVRAVWTTEEQGDLAFACKNEYLFGRAATFDAVVHCGRYKSLCDGVWYEIK